MPNVTYLLINTSKGMNPWPLAVNGLQTIGHADYDPKYDAHVFRISEEQWLGGIDREIAEHGNRKFNRWIVRVEITPEEGSLEAELAELRKENEKFRAQFAHVSEDGTPERMTPEAFAEMQRNTPSAAPIFDIPPFSSVTPEPETPPEQKSIDGPKSIAEMDWDELKKELVRVNADGAGIVIEGYPTRVKLRDALEKHAKSEPSAA